MNGFVKLRIAGAGLDIQDITAKLGRDPDFSYRKGDVHVDKITGRTVVYEEDCWLAQAK